LYLSLSWRAVAITTTLTTATNILKEVYEPRVRDQLQSEVITISRITKTSEGVETDSIGGKYVRFGVRVQRNHGIGSRLEMEALPSPKTQDYRDAQLRLSYGYGAIQLSGQSFELADSNVQAFATVLDQEVDGMREGLRKETNRQVYGTNTGILAVATASGSTTTFITTNAQYLEIGMFVDQYNSTDTNSVNVLTNANVQIQDITTVAGVSTVTFATAVTTTTAGFFLTRTGSRSKEPVGFEQIVAGLTNTNVLGTGGGALYNITHSTWSGNMDSTAGAISEGRMINLVDVIRTKGGRTTVGFCSLGVRRAYANLLEQQRRYVNTTEFTGGFKGISFTTDYGEIPIVADFDCQPGRLYFMNEKEIKIYQNADWSWMNRDGNMWQRLIDSSGEYDAYRARMFKYWQIGTHRRNTHGLMTGIIEA
jgi:hypothetical protein